MPIDRSAKIAFVHIPRTGGTSIEKLLGIYGSWPDCRMDILHGCLNHGGEELRLQHLTLDEMSKLSGLNFSGWYKFAFVRNPWDRLVSHFQWKARNLGTRRVGPFASYVEQVARIVATRENIGGMNCHLRPQVEFLSDDLDFVGRFESFQSDLATALRRIGVRARPLHEHRTSRGPYTEYYDEVARKRVAEIYASDIESLGYRFGV